MSSCLLYFLKIVIDNQIPSGFYDPADCTIHLEVFLSLCDGTSVARFESKLEYDRG